MEDKIKEIISEHLGIDECDCGLDMNITNDLGADSIDGIEILMALEDEYDILLTDDLLSYDLTVEKVIDIVKARIEE